MREYPRYGVTLNNAFTNLTSPFSETTSNNQQSSQVQDSEIDKMLIEEVPKLFENRMTELTKAGLSFSEAYSQLTAQCPSLFALLSKAQCAPVSSINKVLNRKQSGSDIPAEALKLMDESGLRDEITELMTGEQSFSWRDAVKRTWQKRLDQLHEHGVLYGVNSWKTLSNANPSLYQLYILAMSR